MKDIFMQYPILNKWWVTLVTYRKKIYLGSIVSLVLGLLLTWFIVSGKIDSLNDKIVQNQKLIVWMKSASDDINKLRNTVQPKSNKNISLLALIDQESKINSWNNYPMQMKQAEINQVEVSFVSISFDDLISGLEQLWQKNGVQISKLSAQRIANTPFIHATVLLQLS